MNIRAVEPRDDEALIAMVTEAFGPITWYRKVEARYGAPGGCDWRELWRQRMTAALANQVCLVGERDGELITFAAGTYNERSRTAFLDILAVREGLQGEGLGRRMLRAFFDQMKAQGAEFANLECLTDNDAGNALYESEGFEEAMRSIRWVKRL